MEYNEIINKTLEGAKNGFNIKVVFMSDEGG